MASYFLQDRVCRAEANQFMQETVNAAEKIRLAQVFTIAIVQIIVMCVVCALALNNAVLIYRQ